MLKAAHSITTNSYALIHWPDAVSDRSGASEGFEGPLAAPDRGRGWWKGRLEIESNELVATPRTALIVQNIGSGADLWQQSINDK